MYLGLNYLYNNVKIMQPNLQPIVLTVQYLVYKTPNIAYFIGMCKINHFKKIVAFKLFKSWLVLYTIKNNFHKL